MSTVRLFADCFSPSASPDAFTASPCRTLWERWMRENPDANRLLLRIYHPERVDDEGTFLVPVGDPVPDSEVSESVYLPMWMLDANRLNGSGEEVLVELLDAKSLPRASRIVLRAVDSALHEVDVVTVFERCFSRLGALQENHLYLIPLEELGGFQVSVFVQKLEPAAEVYLDGDEVPLEFERAVDYVEPPPRPPTPIPAGPPPLAPGQPDLMVPANFLGPPPGADLNYAYSSRPPTLPGRGGGTALRRGTTSHHPPGFVPFSGAGRTLGEN